MSLVVLGGLLSSLAHVMNNSVWLCAAKPYSILETPFCVDGLPLILTLYRRSQFLGFVIGALDKEAVTHITRSACVRAGH